jgi:GWxTD domain-containing protein
MKINYRILYIPASFFLVAAVTLISCKTTKPAVDTKDVSYIYNPTKNRINPRYNVINQSDNRSVVSIKFFATDLYFTEANPQGIPTASMKVTVRVYNISQGKVLTDTASLDLNIVKIQGKPDYIYDIPVDVESGNEYIAEIRTLDKLRLIILHAFVPFNTLSVYNRYNFTVVSHFSKTRIFNPVLRVNDYINLIYNREHVDSLYISFYKPFTGIPDPPSMILPEKTLDYEPERIIALAYSDTLPMMFPKKGIYLCSVKRGLKEGYTFYNMGDNFPALTTPEVMIEPLAYLASQDELEGLRSAPKPKVALDEFWIKCGGNVEKARELIRIYYTRVLYSNYYFTSYKQGWMTERGMIYIIYGPPDKIYKSDEGELWGYKKPVIKSSWGGRYSVKQEYLYFTFKHRNSVFTDNDFYLSRSETLVTYWDKAILSWRKGIVFRLDNPEGI